MQEKPAFEIRSPDGTAFIRIYACGVVESSMDLPSIVVNRIPALIAQAQFDALEKVK